MTFLSLSMLLASCAQDEILDHTPTASQSEVQSNSSLAKGIPINQEIFITETTNHPQILSAGSSFALSHEQREYKLIMQEDGNLVLYYRNKDGAVRPLWATNTNIKNAAFPHLIAQNDGNLVIYNLGNPLWSSNTTINGTVSNPHIKIQLFKKYGPFIPYGFRIKVILGGNNEERALITSVDVNEYD